MKYEFKGSTEIGKWLVSENFNGEPCVIAVEKGWTFGKCFVVEELGQEGFAEHDAHLIAAAPDLLEACTTAMLLLIDRELDDTETFKFIQTAVHKALNIQP
jgi:hypothetical protein